MTQQQESLIEFPCRFPVKVMGAHSEDFHQIVLGIAQKHSPEVTFADLEMRVSKNGNYLAVTVTIYAVSKAQLDNLYMDLTGHPLVKVAL